MLKNMRIRAKLLLLALIPVLGAILVTALAVNSIRDVSSDMRKALYEEGLASMELILNADRDLYQSMSYYQEVGRSGISLERKQELFASFEAEAGQALDRAGQALAIVDRDAAVWGASKHPDSGRTVHENLADFCARCGQWVQDAKDILDVGWKSMSFLNTPLYEEFNDIRMQLNEAEENIQGAIELEMARIENYISRTTITSIAIDVAAIAVTVVLAGLVIAGIAKPLNLTARMVDELAEGNLTARLDVKSKDEIGMMAGSINRFAGHLAQTMGGINDASAYVATAAGQVSSMSMSLSQGSAEQAGAVEQFNASLEDIAAKTGQNAQYAAQANTLSDTTKDRAEQGNAKMNAMLTAMSQIDEASGNISKIIKVIDDIAFQTNILALNAAVEAARAGEHGKGFAVVAEEVRNLAARSAEAAKETTAMIEASIVKTAAGSKVAQDTATALKEIMRLVQEAAGLMDSIAVSSNEQAMGIEQLRIGLEQITQVVQSNSASSQESSAASEKLLGQAQLLKEQVAYFRMDA
ncbi:MAG: methyl-accepting chemotaxis protein [Christensenellaceae bacterium]|nr:methyl-accepting chemotaxis protein [Christensenellaceae bacterium]